MRYAAAGCSYRVRVRTQTSYLQVRIFVIKFMTRPYRRQLFSSATPSARLNSASAVRRRDALTCTSHFLKSGIQTKETLFRLEGYHSVGARIIFIPTLRASNVATLSQTLHAVT